MQAASITDVQVERPREYRVSPQFRAQVQESCVNRYRMVVEPLSFTEDRASFAWRAPGTGTIMSPNIFLQTEWDITAPTQQDIRTMLGPTFQVLDVTDQSVEAAETRRIGYGSKICFGSGDAFGRAIENIQLVINGASLNQSQMNLYKQTLDRCWFSESVFQRRFSCCGGKQDQYDATAVGGVLVVAVKAVAQQVQGLTGDSGISARIKNYIGCTSDVEAVGIAGTVGVTKRITVRWPVHGMGIFSPIGAQSSDVVATSCPYKRSAYALAHVNVASLDILFKDLKECLFRNLSRGRLHTPAGDGVTRLTNGVRGGVYARLVPNKAQLQLEYMRLASYRGIPQSVNLQCFRVAVHKSSNAGNTLVANTIPADLTRSTLNRELPNALICVGDDSPVAPAAGAATAKSCASFRGSADKTLKAEWNSIVSAQVPSYLFFTLEKSSDVFILGQDPATVAPGAGAAIANSDDGRGKSTNSWNYTKGTVAPADDDGHQGGLENYFLSRNTDCSASIDQFSLEIQSSLGAYTYSDDAGAFIKTRHQLFRDHLRYCSDDYLQGDFEKWSRHQCCLLLGADSFIRGLSTPGCAFPIVINAKCSFTSRRQYMDGHAYTCEGLVPSVFRDVIQGTPVLCMIYPGGSLSLTASAGVLSSQNLGHAQAMDVVSGRSRRPARGAEAPPQD